MARALRWPRWGTGFEIANLGYKWGSTLPSGRVRIHWATMQLRPRLVEYVLAHELAHLREPNHGPAFWQALGRAMPDFEQRKSALAEVGTSIWMGVEQVLDDE